jgi:hypothetical protein
MSSVVYKVIFKGTEGDEEDNFTLTFKEISINEPIKVSPQQLSTLKRFSQTAQNIINFQNIEEVIRIGEPTIGLIINYYIVLLFITKLDHQRKGFLIGNVKGKGDVLLGIWPFTQKLEFSNSNKINKIFNDLIKKPENYNKICLIYM